MPLASEEVEAAAAAAAGRAVSAGIPFSEWFACAALAPIAPLVRQLFVAPRRAGNEHPAARRYGALVIPLCRVLVLILLSPLVVETLWAF